MGVPFDLNLSDFGDFAEQQSQRFAVNRHNAKVNMTTTIAIIKMILHEEFQPQVVLPSGQVIQQSEFKAYLFVPNDSLEVGDIVARPDGELYIDSIVRQHGTNIMVLGLSSKRR